MGAQSVTGTGQGSAEGPLRGYDLDNIRKVYVQIDDNLYPCVFFQNNKWILRSTGEGQIKIDSTDEVPGYAINKLLPGTGINFVLSPGPDKTLTINATGGAGTDKVKVDIADAVADYLANKILPGTNVTFTVSAGPNKTITINSSGGTSTTNLVSGNVFACPAGVAINDAVYVNGGDNVDRANATTIGTAPVFGMVISKPTATTCNILYAGELTGFVGLVPGNVYYLNTINGGITNVAPTTSGNVVQKLGVARNSTTLVAQINSDFILL
jgi:hypothetical protein